MARRVVTAQPPAFRAPCRGHSVRRHADIGSPPGAPLLPADRVAFGTGVLTNVLNPKATLYFLALFPVAVSPTTPKLVQAGYGVWLILTTMAWFCFVSLLFTRPGAPTRFFRHGHWIDRALGVVFLGFALSLLFATLQGNSHT